MIKWFSRIREYAYSNKHSLEERRFLMSGVVICVGIISVLISVITTDQGTALAIGLTASLMVTVAIIAYSLRTHKIKIGGCIIMLLCNIIIIPIGYLLGGGVDSGAPLWLVLGVVFTFVMLRGALLYVYLFITMISFGITMYIGFAHPGLVTALQAGYSKHLDTYVAAMMVSILCGILFLIQSNVLEHEITNAKDQSEQIEKLNETQNNFFSSMSHEIRTPINTIIGLNEMNMREKNLPMEVVENTLNIQNASKMLLTLINDLLDMSKIQSEKMEIVPAEYDTSRMLSDLTNLHWNRAMDKDLRFDIQVGEDLPPMLVGDETRIKQVVTNLLTNAIKYTEEGSVTLKFGGEFVGSEKFMLTIEVEDTGIGIRRENMDTLFDAFRRVEGKDTKNIEGTGLGLAISKQLVDLMGGSLTVDSIYTKGSTFRAEIPQGVVSTERMSYRKPGLVAMDRTEYQQSFEAPEASVLVVDDNDMNRIVCQKLLRATKVQVDAVASGRECLEKTREKHYDTILMDHEMPQMDGIETLRKLRQQADGLCRETPVIALTANAGSDREAFYLDQGFSAYLSKPIQSSQLESLLLSSLPPDLVERNTSMNAEFETIQTHEVVHKIPFIVTTDSICDLPENLLSENDIRVMPYYIETGQGRFRDTEEIDADNLRHFIKGRNQVVQSAPAPVNEYEQFFGNALTEARFVLHLSSSAQVSGAYRNALDAARSFGNVMVLDTGQISSGLGMMAIRASELFKSGMRLEETLEELERFKKRIVLKYLVPSIGEINTKHKIGVVSRSLMNVLNMEPVFTIRKGRLKISRFLLGYVRSTSDQFIRSTFRNRAAIRTSRLYVTFSGCPIAQREHVLREIEKCIHFDELIVNKSSAASYANIGSNSIGLIYEAKLSDK